MRVLVFLRKRLVWGYHQPEEVGANPDRLDAIESIVKAGFG